MFVMLAATGRNPAPAVAQGAQAGTGSPAAAATPAPNAIVPGELLIDPPTLLNLGFEWFVQGDDNPNATVAGVVLPTVTDGFTGRAPDLGALETDAATPTYGPRPLREK
jgi:hypothetical protein